MDICYTFCLKCGHPICPTSNPRTTSPTDHNQTIIIQQPVRQSNGTGTAGFVLSLIALILSWLPGVGWVVWFLGFLLSFIGIFKSPRGLAITGFIISIIDLIILVALEENSRQMQLFLATANEVTLHRMGIEAEEPVQKIFLMP